jgi:hypothetical protein
LPEHHPDFDFFESRKDMLLRLAVESDEVWVSTTPLAEKLSRLARNVVTIRNALDDRLWQPRLNHKEQRRVRCVYIGGSSHRIDFLEIIEPGIVQLKSEFGDHLEFDVIGVTSEPSSNGSWRLLTPPLGVANCYPAFVCWLQNLPRYDIGVAPLQDIPFNHLKSEVKWLEYSAMGLATVASNLPPYASSIGQDRTGLLVGSDWKSFCDAIRELFENATKRQFIQHQASEAVGGMLNAARFCEPRLERLVALTSSHS